MLVSDMRESDICLSVCLHVCPYFLIVSMYVCISMRVIMQYVLIHVSLYVLHILSLDMDRQVCIVIGYNCNLYAHMLNS